MHVRGAFNHILRPGLRSDFRDSYLSFESEYDGILKVGTMDRAEIEATTQSGLGRQVVLPEGEAYTIMDTELADKVTFVDTQYGLGFSISQQMMEDDLYGQANQSAKWLARSTRLIQEYITADWLDDAFDGNTFTGFATDSLRASRRVLLFSVELAGGQMVSTFPSRKNCSGGPETVFEVASSNRVSNTLRVMFSSLTLSPFGSIQETETRASRVDRPLRSYSY